jgi:hypothetical protein
MGSGLPQFGFPRRFAIDLVSLRGVICGDILGNGLGGLLSLLRNLQLSILRIFSSEINKKMNGLSDKMKVFNFAHHSRYSTAIERITFPMPRRLTAFL